jgi:hypothetical protein
MRLPAQVQPGQHQRCPDAHHPKAQGQAGTPRPVKGEAEAGQKQAGQGQDVHAEQDVFGEHRPPWVEI